MSSPTILRKHVLKMTNNGKSSHVGSALSCADIVFALYFRLMNIDPENPKMPERDRFILSKGHAGSAVYAALAMRGFFDEAELVNHYSNGSNLSGHVSHKGVPGVELSTGSLGHGLSVGTGIAFGLKQSLSQAKTIVLLSDGELNEGSNWEAIMFASHHRLGKLIAIVDYNKLQSLESTHKTLDLEPLSEKFTSFGWSVVEIDGHDIPMFEAAYRKHNADVDKPMVIIAHTTKGKGVSFMENQVHWHYAPPSDTELMQALEELETHA